MTQSTRSPPSTAELERLGEKLRDRERAVRELYVRAEQARAAAADDLASAREQTLARERQTLAAALRDVRAAGARRSHDGHASARQAASAFVASPAAASWDQPAWTTAGRPGVAPTRQPAAAVRIGGCDTGARDPLPALVPAMGCNHVLVTAPEAARDAALAVVETIVVRTLATAAPGAVRFRVFDPVGLGASLGALSRFEPPVRHGPPISDRAGLADALDELTRHATDVAAVHLQGRYATLRDYVAAGGGGELHHEVLCLLDAPRGTDDELREQLSRLAAHAADRGILVIAHQVAGSPALDLGRAVVRIDVESARTARADWLPGIAIALDERPPGPVADALAGRRVERAAPLELSALLAGEEGTSSSAAGLTTTLGRAGTTDVAVSFGDETAHALIAGNTGSGKSNLLRALVYGLARRHSTDELRLYLLDFKEGVEFQEFAASPADLSFLPHAEVVSVNSSREFGVAVLEHVDRLVADRYRLFNATPGVSKLAELRERRPDLTLPRVLLVIDEFHRLFDVDDQLGDAAVDALLRIARQGRAAGVHFALATQSIGDVGVDTRAGIKLDGVFKNAPLRIGMRLSEDESRAIFRVSNTAAAEIHEPGMAIVNPQGGAEAGNRLIKVAYVSPAGAGRERRAALGRVRGPRRPPRVFDGARGADAAANWELRAAVRGRGADGGVWRTWAGAALRLDDEDPRGQPGHAVTFGRDAHRNVAVIGAGIRAALGLLQWSAIGLAAAPEPVEVTIVDLMRADDVVGVGAPPDVADATADACAALGATVTRLRSGRAEELLDVLRRDAVTRGVVCVFDAERLDGLDDEQPQADEDDWQRRTVGDALAEALASGPRRGLHTLAWWPTVAGFRRMEAAHDCFGMRAYLGLPPVELMALAGRAIDPSSDPIAVWHDHARAADPVRVQVYEPFGAREVPAWLS